MVANLRFMGSQMRARPLYVLRFTRVEYQESTPVNQSLLVAKSRVAPKDTSIPKLELLAAMTLAKLQSNVLRALKLQHILSVHNWVDSVTVLYWLANKGTWSAFVRNRVKKIKELGDAE